MVPYWLSLSCLHEQKQNEDLCAYPADDHFHHVNGGGGTGAVVLEAKCQRTWAIFVERIHQVKAELGTPLLFLRRADEPAAFP